MKRLPGVLWVGKGHSRGERSQAVLRRAAGGELQAVRAAKTHLGALGPAPAPAVWPLYWSWQTRGGSVLAKSKMCNLVFMFLCS